MRFPRNTRVIVLICALIGSAGFAEEARVAHFVGIVLNDAADDAQTRVAGVLQDRIRQRGDTQVEFTQAGMKGVDLQVYLGRMDAGSRIARLCAEHEVSLPGRGGPAPEGFAIKTVIEAGVPSVIAVGADNRGLLYAVGELLRRMRYAAHGVVLGDLDVQSAPDYRFRGSSANQGGTMMEATGARPWSAEQWQHYAMDLALSGANCFYAGGAAFDFVKSFDLMVETGCRPNELSGFPKEWKATEFGNWVCPSIPEAHEALMARWRSEMPKRSAYDVLRFFAGDPGGCRCERCMPWGKTFVHLCEEVAAIWLEHNPDGVVLIANQDLTNAGDQAIFDYCTEQPRTWLYGIAYGPGSNALSDYFRSELREDLFVYPGGGAVNRYLAETLNQLPKEQRIVHYSDITHWISAQYMVENPDPYIRALYGRRTFHVRPQAFYRIFHEIMPFSEGDIIYSEGYHDEFHQYLWNRLLWDSQRSLDDITLEYCRYHFGEAAAALMRDALYQIESALETPFPTNPGVDRYYDLVKQAGDQIPAHLMQDNHRWRLCMQKAALDCYFQRKVRIALSQEERAVAAARAGFASGDVDAAIAQVKAILSEPLETGEMKALREEALRLSQETDAIFGIRNIGCAALDKPFRSLFKLSRRLSAAEEARSPGEKRAALEKLAAYESNPRMSPLMDH